MVQKSTGRTQQPSVYDFEEGEVAVVTSNGKRVVSMCWFAYLERLRALICM